MQKKNSIKSTCKLRHLSLTCTIAYLKTPNYWPAFVIKTRTMQRCLWEWGLIVHVLPGFLLKCHFGIVRIQLENAYKRKTNRVH